MPNRIYLVVRPLIERAAALTAVKRRTPTIRMRNDRSNIDPQPIHAFNSFDSVWEVTPTCVGVETSGF